ncbi:hypothetical protein IQ226_15630 [Dolichospermum sp. LEGE 00240]|uniref:hypothetical protein n=1 Tax=Dolichospermum sp. LEGE 00240 TaxID=1828603 RepID=UPI00187E9A1F|nr:hypothetical protein [Dolichospermum sp. LEGE 00240]MBE9250547.1 hypothetical protein [Dolichospermum sp. LEGE 00240]
MKADNLEIYADGAGLMVRPTISKLSFYSVVDISENHGQKETEEELKVQIVIPTLTLLKLCARFLTQVKTDEKGIINTIDSHKEEIIKTLANLTLKESDGE